jgi:hypothetical protein
LARKAGVNANKLILEAIDGELHKEADLKRIQKLTGLERTTVWRGIGRLMKVQSIEAHVSLSIGEKEVHPSIVYRIPEPLRVKSPQVVELVRRKEKAKKRVWRELGVIVPALLEDPDYAKLQRRVEIMSKVEGAISYYKRLTKGAAELASVVGKDRDRVLENLAAVVTHQGGFLINFLREHGKRVLPWTREQIREVLDDMLRSDIIRLVPVYMIDMTAASSSKLVREYEKTRSLMLKEEQRIRDKLRIEGKLKPKIVVPLLSK